MANIIYLDTETTGRNPVRNSIHEMSGIIEIDGEVVNEFSFCCRPAKPYVEPDAVSVSNKTVEQIKKYPSSRTKFFELVDILKSVVPMGGLKERLFVCGYNVAGFDIPFIKEWFIDHTNNSEQYSLYFHSAPLDVFTLAAEDLLKKGVVLTSYSLVNVAKAYGLNIEKERLHQSKFDCELSRDLYKLITNKIQ